MNGTKTTIWLYILIAFAVFSAVPDIHAATPSATPIADVAQNEADTINLDVAGSFSDGDGHTLTFTATGLPEGIGISSAGLISGKLPKVTANTSYGVTVTATDPGNLTADQSFALTVINSINELPVLARNTVLRINQDAAAGTIGNNYLQLTDENNPGAGSLTYTLTAVPVKGTLQKGNSALAVGATFTQADIDVGSISFAPSGSANGADGFSFTYTDDFGETQGPAVFTITIVDNIPPTMNGTAVYVDSTHVEVTFSEEVKGADAPANYGAGNDLKISQVAWVSGNIYRLTTSVQTIGVAYTITGNAITDLADNGLAAGSKTATFIRSETANSAPTTPVLKAPASGGANTAGEVSTLTPTLSVNAVTDPDSDPVTYTFEVSTTSDPPVVVAYKEGITAENGAASFTVPTSLAENTIYQWRVQAYDGHLYSGYMPTATFFVNTTAEAPTDPAVSYPAAGTEVPSLTPELSVTNATDPDQDTLTYYFDLATDQGFAAGNIVASGTGIAQGTGGSTAWTVPPDKAKDNSRYFWRCRAVDHDGKTSNYITSSFFINTANDAPTAPTLSAPANGSPNVNEVNILTPTLVVNNATDPDPVKAALTYTFEIDTVNTFDSAGKQVSPAIPEGAGTTAWPVAANLTENTTCYWRAKANDGAADGPWMTTGSFFVSTKNIAPNIPALVSPPAGGEADSLTPVLSVQGSDVNGDTMTYTFEVFTDSSMEQRFRVAYAVDQPASWIVTPPLTDNTRYYWTAMAKDLHGTFSRTMAAQSFIVKNKDSGNAAPTMTITAPGANEPVMNKYSINSYTITWTAADPDSPALIALYHAPDAGGTGGTLIASGLSKNVTSYTWDTSVLQDGSYYVYGVIADGKSQVTAVSAGPIVIDRTLPTPPEVSGVTLTNNPTPTWSWTGNGGGSGTYRYKLDSEDLTTGATETPDLTFTPASALGGGEHTLYVQERDVAGNWSPSGSYRTNIDLILPEATISGAPVQATADTSVTLTVSGDDVVIYRYRQDGGEFSGERPVGDPIQLAALGDGGHAVAVIGRDSAGNWQTTESTVQWIVDITPPGAVITSVPSSPTNRTAATLVVGGEGVTAYRYKFDDGAYSSETPVSTPITLVSLTEGNHTVSVIGRDGAGNWQTEGSAATAAWMVDLTPAVMNVSTLLDGNFTNVAELNISGTVTDASGIASLALEYAAEGTTGSGEVILDGKGAFSHIATLAVGANKLTLTATDRAGNRTGNTRTINYDPFGPELTITSPADNLKTNQSFVKINGTTNETATIEVTTYDRNQTPASPQLASISGADFTATANLFEGLNTVVITAQDQTGTRSSYKRTVTYDNQKPNLAITEPVQDLRTNLHIMTIKGAVSDALSEVAVTVKQDGNEPEPVLLVTGESGQSFEKTVTFTDSKVYHFVVTATDAAGNETTVQRNVIFAAPAWGDINSDDRVDILDALIALQISNGMLTQTDFDLIRGDVAPLIDGKPVSDGRINVGDAVVILQAAVKLITLEAPQK